jgi:methionyl-tRNA formyltransferase
MNVVVVTTREPVYHQYLCAELVKRHHVVAVLHPRRAAPSRRERRALHRKSIAKVGLLQHLLIKLGDNRFRRFGWDQQRDLAQAQRRFFPDAPAEYARLAAPLARDVDDINGSAGVELMRSLAPDVVVCSGGPIYREPLIRAAKLMLNYHTGISPLYNGSLTVYWTYANRQPHLTGGTLMRMSPVIDGGDILAHYLPAVEATDGPADQFMKCIAGGVRLYDRFLTDLAAGKPFVAVPQGPPFLYYVGQDWSVQQNLAVERHVEAGICAKHVRDERVHEYWRRPDAASARDALRQVLLDLVYRG